MRLLTNKQLDLIKYDERRKGMYAVLDAAKFSSNPTNISCSVIPSEDITIAIDILEMANNGKFKKVKK